MKCAICNLELCEDDCLCPSCIAFVIYKYGSVENYKKIKAEKVGGKNDG